MLQLLLLHHRCSPSGCSNTYISDKASYFCLHMSVTQLCRQQVSILALCGRLPMQGSKRVQEAARREVTCWIKCDTELIVRVGLMLRWLAALP